MRGRVFDISRACFHDGPGLRTVVFLKGCHLKCPWCHNLEGLSFGPELFFDRNRCIKCGTCSVVCPQIRSERGRPVPLRESCTGCGRCAGETCPPGARRLVGRDLTVSELCDEVMIDDDFFRSTGGGVTFSGGEPLAQPEFTLACARRLRSLGIHVALETSGYWPDEHLDDVVENTDLILFDLKHIDPAQIDRVTSNSGAGEQILKNLEELIKKGFPIELRLTLIPGFNTDDDVLSQLRSWRGTFETAPKIRVLPFHRMATGKQTPLNTIYPYAKAELLNREDLERVRRYINANS